MKMMHRRALAALFTLLAATSLAPGRAAAAQAAPSRSLAIAAAADLQPVMPVLAEAYEKKTGVKLKVSFGSSSALAAQILNGDPVDVFLGADYSFPEKVVAAGLADEKAPEEYAHGTLVVWARKDAAIQPVSIDKLTDPRVTRISVADEFHAPYGRAAYATMRQMKLLEGVRAKLVTAENVGQAAQFVESGNAQIGFISLTLATSPHMQDVGSYARVPAVYPKIRQCGVVLKGSRNRDEAREFMHWLLSPAVQENLTKFGLDPVR